MCVFGVCWEPPLPLAPAPGPRCAGPHFARRIFPGKSCRVPPKQLKGGGVHAGGLKFNPNFAMLRRAAYRLQKVPLQLCLLAWVLARRPL